MVLPYAKKVRIKKPDRYKIQKLILFHLSVCGEEIMLFSFF